MKTKTLPFGQAINYKAPNPPRTLVKSAPGGSLTFCEFKTDEKAQDAFLNDGEKANPIGYRKLHPRNI